MFQICGLQFGHLPRALSHLFLVLSFAGGLGACGSSSGDNGGNANPPNQALSVSGKPGTDGEYMLVRLMPDVPVEGPNLAWIPPYGQTVGETLLLHPPRTIEGYHWEWTKDVRLKVWLDERPVTSDQVALEENQWVALGELDAGSLFQSEFAGRMEAARAIAFQIDASQPPQHKKWPAVVGLGNSKTSAMSLTSLSPLTPKSPGTPISFEIQGDGLEIFSRAQSCGALCLRFKNALEAYDSPFLIRKIDSILLNETEPNGIRLLAFSRSLSEEANGGIEESSIDSCVANWTSSLTEVGGLLNLLKQKWGTPEAISEGYDVYFAHQTSGVVYQGLEHSTSTLIALSGQCDSRAHGEALSGLMAHELVHVWNVKHLFPIEHKTVSLDTFDSSRTKQLYFYEGWTEGFALVGLSQMGALSSEQRLRSWNSKIASLQASFSGLSNGKELVLNVADANNAFGQYNTGASFLLYVALKLRNEKGAELAQDLFWSFMADLRDKVDASKTVGSLVSPPWEWRIWSGISASTPPDRAQGYTSEDIVALLEDRLGTIPGTAVGQVGLTSESFDLVLSQYAAETGLGASRTSSGAWTLSEGTALTNGELPWPFGPR